MPCARESQGLLEQKREAPRRLTHRISCNALKICKLGGGTSESSIEYLDVSGIDVPYEISMFLGGLAKFTQTKVNSEELAYKGIADAYTMMKHGGYDGILKITALAIPTGILDLPIKVTYLPTGQVTDEGVTKDVLDAGMGGLVATVLNCPRITKEQFYTLE